jgi:hypothetical protein
MKPTIALIDGEAGSLRETRLQAARAGPGILAIDRKAVMVNGTFPTRAGLELFA